MKFYVLAIGEKVPDFVSSRIQKAIGANYSHIAVLCGDDVYHAEGVGVHKQKLNEVLHNGESIIRRKIEIPVQKDCCSITWLEARIGTKYSIAQYFGFLFPWLRFLPKISNGRKETICSEFGADFVWDCVEPKYMEICRAALGECDFVDPKQLTDILAGIFGEESYVDQV